MKVMQQVKNSMETIDTIAIYGMSGHGKVVADVARSLGFTNIFWIDDNPEITETLSFDHFTEEYRTIPVALGVGNNILRAQLYNRLQEKGIAIISLIHPTATVSPSATIEIGTIIMPHAVINAEAKIGLGVIINSASVVEHNCTVGDFAHISPNAAIAGNVSVGKRVHIGIGSCVIQSRTIGDDAIIGAGSTVITDIPAGITAVGSPARPIGSDNA